jgi:hypothetical protein
MLLENSVKSCVVCGLTFRKGDLSIEEIKKREANNFLRIG